MGDITAAHLHRPETLVRIYIHFVLNCDEYLVIKLISKLSLYFRSNTYMRLFFSGNKFPQEFFAWLLLVPLLVHDVAVTIYDNSHT